MIKNDSKSNDNTNCALAIGSVVALAVIIYYCCVKREKGTYLALFFYLSKTQR